MRLQDFRALVDRLVKDVPPEYLDGIIDVEISPRTVPHPVYGGTYTLGECIPVDVSADQLPSRVVLYHGSFQALARERAGFAWREETWETLTHELRHHLEWRANTTALERYDWATEQNFARHEDQAFDPTFYLAGERIADGVYQVDDDVFWDRPARRRPDAVDIQWHGRRHVIQVPDAPLPVYVLLEGLIPAPVGEGVVAIRRKAGLADLWRRPAPLTVVRARVAD